jgi:ferrous iron transport protein A
LLHEADAAVDSCRAWHETDAIQPLSLLRKGSRGVVSGVSDPESSGSLGDAVGSTVARRLMELGFIAGERIEVLEEVRPGGDPIAVRIGNSMFALRRREAQAILVQIEAP